MKGGTVGYRDDCDHDWDNCYCDRCGRYQGQECNACGAWYDGGDYMASREDLWCKCGPDEYERDLRRQAADPYPPAD